MPISTSVKNIPGRSSSAQYEIVFRTTLPALGFNTYYFEVKSSDHNLDDSSMKATSSIRITHNEACILQNEVIKKFVDDEQDRFFLFSSMCNWYLMPKEI